MAIERVGLALDLVERIGQPFGGGGLGDALRDAAVALGRAELGGQIVLAADAVARHPGIEKIGAEAHLDRNLGLERDRLLEPPLADEAPRADDVGYHVDRQGGHGRLLVREQIAHVPKSGTRFSE